MRKAVICSMLVLAVLCPRIMAKDEAVEYFTFEAETDTVSAEEVFYNVLSDRVTDIQITGHGATFYFAYDSLFRNMGKWVDFSPHVGIKTLGEYGASEKIKEAIGNVQACVLDFTDGDRYPGLAEVSVEAGEAYAGKLVDIYHYVSEEDGDRLEPVVRQYRVNENGVISLTISSAKDYLVLESSGAAARGSHIDNLMPGLLPPGEGDSSAGLIAVVVICAVLVTGTAALVLILQARRRAFRKRGGKQEMKSRTGNQTK